GPHHVHRGGLGKFTHIRAGRERPIAAGEHNTANPRGAVELFQRRGEFGHQRLVERVEHLRPVEGDHPDRVLGSDTDMLVRHACVLHPSGGYRAVSVASNPADRRLPTRRSAVARSKYPPTQTRYGGPSIIVTA